ncbi:riboflavin kinase/FMN adenylyltransferase [Salsuginibacillus halophilus]|uniref:Riboflavin biosynthesis protein n=1 Tax=Salsuginibacillus halophilus TaxID=517424 RepID=A0A2P8HQI5_9BACI|nr:FAD synthetase family protein [Salsuginibacillus halophilus]PSL48476.1 riboflavin kinase/FMN adenylyltransferase [Salsuginibacillus halophilus]
MQTIRVSYPIQKSVQLQSEPCVMALGFFDGVHLGHQEIIKTARAEAERKGLKLAVMTFSPHPSVVIKKGKQINEYITPIFEKEKIFEKLRVDFLYVVDFNEEVARIPHQDFVDDFLCGLQCEHAVAGFDYTYGFKGQGTMDQLKVDAKARFAVTVVSKKEKNQQKISSTLLRELITSGRVERVPSYLGKSYKIEGELYNDGNKTFIEVVDDYLLPCSGTYEVSVRRGIFHEKAVCEVTKLGQKRCLEVYGLQSEAVFTGETVHLQWHNFIADPQNYPFHVQSTIDEFEALSVSV